MSAPAQKPRPAPVITITFTSGSSVHLVQVGEQLLLDGAVPR
jgi:hypothetical protein